MSKESFVLFFLQNALHQERCGWSMAVELIQMREELKFALEGSGGQCVMICGTIVMLQLFAGNSDLEQQVRIIIIFKYLLETILNFSGALAQTGSHYGPGRGPVHLDDVQCTGFEENIYKCSHRYFGYVGSNCRTHNEDASVVCPTSMF